MRLTMTFFLNKVKPHGKLFRGKNRKVKKITLNELNDLRNDFEREERNMMFLRHPYLTPEQSKGHMKELRMLKPHPLEKLMERKALKFSREYSFADALSHLRVKDAWD